MLKRKGILYASFKYGNGERIAEGRYFNDISESECKCLFRGTYFDVLEVYLTEDVRTNRMEK